MNRKRVSGETAPRSTGSDIYNNIYDTEETGESSSVANADEDEHEGADSTEVSDWLMEATAELSKDLNTSKKELDIIKFILEEIKLRLRSDDRSREGQVELMLACREYSSSRCGFLRDRIRQVQFWARNRMLGQQVPSKAPEEWRLADDEWRRWLSGQASSRADQLSGSGRVTPFENVPDPFDDIVWSGWGPLPYILSADVWWKELS
ncbi:hypothetical protein F4678DRAFT_466865 [Xylaria arbuscula]|nr:hypothetical protein F4678DRAFT_466865 [Xylaria arbuscula]